MVTENWVSFGCWPDVSFR